MSATRKSRHCLFPSESTMKNCMLFGKFSIISACLSENCITFVHKNYYNGESTKETHGRKIWHEKRQRIAGTEMPVLRTIHVIHAVKKYAYFLETSLDCQQRTIFLKGKLMQQHHLDLTIAKQNYIEVLFILIFININIFFQIYLFYYK